MTDGTSEMARGREWIETSEKSLVTLFLVVAAVGFNAVLAIINGSVTSLGSKHVIAVEVMIVALAQAYALLNFNARMVPWYGFMTVVVVFALLRMAAVGDIDVKYIRDMLLIQTFVVLGMTANMVCARRAFLVIAGLVVTGVLLESVSLDTYSAIFQIKQFYINTRGLVSAEFTAAGSELYVSAIRPEARYLPFFGLHRMSSVFLEPVSLGNYAIVLVCATLAFWSRLSLGARVFALFSIGLVLFASDGRLAIAAISFVLLAAVFVRLLPGNIALLALPAVVLATVLVVLVKDLNSGRDNLAGRLAYTVELISDMRLIDYLGLSNRLLEKSVDSGIVYLVITQSVVIVAVLWILIVTGIPERSDGQRNYKNGICIYLALTMLVSYSFVSIKTAAPLWFFYGVLAASAALNTDPKRAELAKPDTPPNTPLGTGSVGA